MPRIMPEGWHMIQGVGLGVTACLGWKLTEFTLKAVPGFLDFCLTLASAQNG